MPHVRIQIYPGKTEEQKAKITEAILKDFVTLLDYKESAVSISFEEVEPKDWAESVYRTEILEKSNQLYKKPGYNPFENKTI